MNPLDQLDWESLENMYTNLKIMYVAHNMMKLIYLICYTPIQEKIEWIIMTQSVWFWIVNESSLTVLSKWSLVLAIICQKHQLQVYL